MENQAHSKCSMFKFCAGALSPISVQTFVGGRRCSSIFDPYASDSSDTSSPLMKYFCSTEPAAAVDPTVFITPMKIEEDVLVMDGIPVPKSSKGGSDMSGKPSARSSGSSIGGYSAGRSNSISSSSSRSGRTGSNSDKSEHAKEELRPPRLLGKKNRPEIGKPQFNSGGSSSSSYGKKSGSVNKTKATSVVSSPPIPPRMALSTSSPEDKSSSEPTNFCVRAPAPALPAPAPAPGWTPQYDGIEIDLPSAAAENKNPSKEDVDDYIYKLLYANHSRKRLSVFEEICPN